MCGCRRPKWVLPPVTGEHMSSEYPNDDPPRLDGETSSSVEYLLFDSLVHHLIEKGVLTKNDALSVTRKSRPDNSNRQLRPNDEECK